MAIDQIFIKAKEEVREKLKQKDRMGAIKTQDRVREPLPPHICIPIHHLLALEMFSSLGRAVELTVSKKD